MLHRLKRDCCRIWGADSFISRKHCLFIRPGQMFFVSGLSLLKGYKGIKTRAFKVKNAVVCFILHNCTFNFQKVEQESWATIHENKKKPPVNFQRLNSVPNSVSKVFVPAKIMSFLDDSNNTPTTYMSFSLIYRVNLDKPHIKEHPTLVLVHRKHFTVCFFGKWPQTKCKVTFDTSFWPNFLCSFTW